jgi:hypothetical protein
MEHVKAYSVQDAAHRVRQTTVALRRVGSTLTVWVVRAGFAHRRWPARVPFWGLSRSIQRSRNRSRIFSTTPTSGPRTNTPSSRL